MTYIFNNGTLLIYFMSYKKLCTISILHFNSMVKQYPTLHNPILAKRKATDVIFQHPRLTLVLHIYNI